MHFTLEEAFAPQAFLLHAGYLLLIGSMLMTRLKWLRILAIGSGVLEGSYYMLIGDANSLFWETLFVLTNVGQLLYLSYLNRMTHFNADERAFYEVAVPELDPADARKLIRAGRWLTAPAGTVLAKEGQTVTDLAFIVEGTVDIVVNGLVVGHCPPGSFVGEISASTGGPATADAVAQTPIRYLAFDRKTLMKLLDTPSDIGRAIEAAFRSGLRDKLVRTNVAMAAAVRPITP